ncbi:c-type cytochrome biogenesis protein CcmI [Dokdonella sp. MW10]|uniref:c-type cytochrome biogenesis protein CcmI n=1 Tax=Dokdonella sp. MW10 TaxID=2992926 RepID=UPI003F7DF3E8
MTTFAIWAVAMLVAALAFPLVPLMRGRRAAAATPDARRLKALDEALATGVIDADEYARKRATLAATTPAAAEAGPVRTRAAVTTALLLAVTLPIAAILLYRAYGEPDALDPARIAARAAAAGAGEAEHGVDMTQAVEGLEKKLREEPNNPDGWALLGRAYQSMGRFPESRDALKRAVDLAPDSTDLQVEYAQAVGLSNEGRRLVGEAREILEKVLAADPGHQRALWLIGISDYQAGQYAAAVDAWNRLLPNLPPESDIAQSVRTQIAEAQRLGGLGDVAPAAAPPVAAATPPAAPANDTTAPASGEGPRLIVRVTLDPKLAAEVPADGTLYIFARAANGPPMPLAIHRGPASALPLTVTLDDSMGMMPSMKLSMFPQVIVGARISRSGNAMAQSGDLQVLSTPIDVTRREPIDLAIDSRVP